MNYHTVYCFEVLCQNITFGKINEFMHELKYLYDYGMTAYQKFSSYFDVECQIRREGKIEE